MDYAFSVRCGLFAGHREIKQSLCKTLVYEEFGMLIAVSTVTM